jgi:membrane protein required for colicin V production
MSLIDVTIVSVLVICAGFGLWKGFVRIAVGLGGLGVSLALALRLSGAGPRWLDGVFASEEISQAAAFVGILVAGLLATSLVAWLATRLVRSAEIGWLDRLLGGGVATVGAALLLCGLMVGVTAFVPAAGAWGAGSKLMPVVFAVSDQAARILPDDLEEVYRSRRKLVEGRRLPLLQDEEAEAGRSGSRSSS